MFNPAFGSITSSINRKYITYRNAARRGPSKDRTCISTDMSADRQTHKHTHTHGHHNTPLACLDVCTYVPRCDWHTLLLFLLYRRRRHPLLPLDAFSETLCVPPTPISAYRSRYIHIYKRHVTAYEVTNLWRYRQQICLL